MQRQDRYRTQLACRPQQIESACTRTAHDPARTAFKNAGRKLLRRNHHHQFFLRLGLYPALQVGSHAPVCPRSGQNRTTHLQNHSALAYSTHTYPFATRTCARMPLSWRARKSGVRFFWSDRIPVSRGPYLSCRAGSSTGALPPGCCGFMGPVPSATLDKRRGSAANANLPRERNFALRALFLEIKRCARLVN